MIDLSQLTDNQLRGVKYACLLHNQESERQFKPVDENDKFVPMLVEDYAKLVFCVVCDSYYSQLFERRIGMAVTSAKQLPAVDQEKILTDLGVPKIVE